MSTNRIAKSFVALAMVLVGLYLAVFGNDWGPLFFEKLETSELGLWLELIVPFLPMLFIATGAVVYVSWNK